MTAETTATKAAARVASELRKAIEQAKLAYQFNPGSYTYGAMSACMAAEKALDVLREALEAESIGRQPS